VEFQAARGGRPPGGEAGGRCPWCGGENGPQARFCQLCGERLNGPELDPDRPSDGPPGTSSIVTAVVCELSPGQTDGRESPSEQELDPEDRMRVREILERYGGVPRELPTDPDTVGAVFGPEPSGSDGPLRALRAAAEIRSAWSTERLAGYDDAGAQQSASVVRIGVGASEVGGEGPEAERLWSQRVLDLAVRLQRMAGPGEVIVSESVYRSVGDAAELRPVDPRAPADGDVSVGPLRLLSVTPGPRRLGLAVPPLSGRDPEMALLREVFEQTVAAQSGSILHLSGEAGVGKTRLVEELLGELEREHAAHTVVVRCRPEAEGGITWPLAELVAGAIGLEGGEDPQRARARIEALVHDDPDAARIAERLLPALGLPGRGVAAETGWALRRLLEGAARHRPLVVAIDDGERAGPAFGLLLEDVVARIRSAPVLVIVVGRTQEAGAGSGRVVRLEPLPDPALGALVGGALGDRALSSELRDALVAPCAGNPLIAEQYAALLVSQGFLRLHLGRWVPGTDPGAFPVPESFQALLELRLRDLGASERALIGAAAVLGDRVDATCLADVLAERSASELPDMTATLLGLRLLREEDGGTLAFVHPLVRMAALATVPAELRAQIHRRCARWLEASDLPAHERSPEVVGWHLEAAGSSDMEMKPRAIALLSAAAESAEALGDLRGALALRLRAAALQPSEDARLAALLLDAGRGHAALGEIHAADGLLAHASRIALTGGERALERRARLLRTALRLDAPDPDALERVREVADETIEECAELGDDLGLAWAWSVRAAVCRRHGHWAAAADAAARAAEHAAAAGRREEEIRALRDLAFDIADGRGPVAESARRCEEILERVRGERPAEQEVAGVLAELVARQGRLDDGRNTAARAAEALEGLGMESAQAACLLALGRIERLAGRSGEAQTALRRAIELAASVGDRVTRLRSAASLAHVLLEAEREAEALELVEDTEPTAGDDVPVRVEWETARARALALSGRHQEANALARRAVKLADQTDLVGLRARALLDLADVLRTAGRPNEALPFVRRALRAFERRGAAGEVAAARAALERIDRPAGETRTAAAEPALVQDGPTVAPEPARTLEAARTTDTPDAGRAAQGQEIEPAVERDELADVAGVDSSTLPPSDSSALPPSEDRRKVAEPQSQTPGRRFRWGW